MLCSDKVYAGEWIGKIGSKEMCCQLCLTEHLLGVKEYKMYSFPLCQMMQCSSLLRPCWSIRCPMLGHGVLYEKAYDLLNVIRKCRAYTFVL